jgi:hypothetical protein
VLASIQGVEYRQTREFEREHASSGPALLVYDDASPEGSGRTQYHSLSHNQSQIDPVRDLMAFLHSLHRHPQSRTPQVVLVSSKDTDWEKVGVRRDCYVPSLHRTAIRIRRWEEVQIKGEKRSSIPKTALLVMGAWLFAGGVLALGDGHSS